MTKQLAIIGSGPAGLMAALLASHQQIAVTIFESQATIGGKLTVAGGGRCNFSNYKSATELQKHYGLNGSFLKFAFRALDSQKTRKLFDSYGIASYVDKEDRVYPQSNSGKKMLQQIEQILLKQNVTILCKQAIKSIHYDDNWQLETADKSYRFEKVIIATGGVGLNLKNDFFEQWQKLNLKNVALKPALTAVSAGEDHSDIAGISLTAVKLRLNNENGQQSLVSPLLITHKGYSGPAIHNISRYFATKNDLYINWLNENQQSMEQKLQNIILAKGKQKLINALTEYHLPPKLLAFILKQNNIDSDVKLAEISKVQRKAIVQALCQFKVANPQVIGFKSAMASAGGLDLSEVNPKTMAVKKYEGLYVIGEALDIDGDSGGYNIQAAFSTAYLAVQALTKK